MDYEGFSTFFERIKDLSLENKICEIVERNLGLHKKSLSNKDILSPSFEIVVDSLVYAEIISDILDVMQEQGIYRDSIEKLRKDFPNYNGSSFKVGDLINCVKPYFSVC